MMEGRVVDERTNERPGRRTGEAGARGQSVAFIWVQMEFFPQMDVSKVCRC